MKPDVPSVEITYEQPTGVPSSQDLRIEHLLGAFPRVSSAPTWTPRTFSQAFAFYHSGTTYRFYIYDYAGSAWRYASMT